MLLYVRYPPEWATLRPGRDGISGQCQQTTRRAKQRRGHAPENHDYISGLGQAATSQDALAPRVIPSTSTKPATAY